MLVSEFEKDLNLDDTVDQSCTDYTRFLGARQGSETLIYLPPEGEWNPTAEAQILTMRRKMGL